MAPAVVQPTMTSRFAGLFASRRGVLAPASSAGTRAPVAPLSPRRHFRGASLGGFGLRAWSRARWPIASPAARLAPGGRANAARRVASRSSDAAVATRARRLEALDAARRRRGDAVVRPAALGPFTALASDSDSDDSDSVVPKKRVNLVAKKAGGPGRKRHRPSVVPRSAPSMLAL